MRLEIHSKFLYFHLYIILFTCFLIFEYLLLVFVFTSLMESIVSYT